MKILKNEQTVIPMNKNFKEQIKKKYKTKRTKKTKPQKLRYLLVLGSFFVIFLLAFAILVLLIQKNYSVFKSGETNEKKKNMLIRPINTELGGLNCTFNKCYNYEDAVLQNPV